MSPGSAGFGIEIPLKEYNFLPFFSINYLTNYKDKATIEEVKANITNLIPGLKFNEHYDGIKDRKIIELDQLDRIINFKVSKINSTLAADLRPEENWY